MRVVLSWCISLPVAVVWLFHTVLFFLDFLAFLFIWLLSHIKLLKQLCDKFKLAAGYLYLPQPKMDLAQNEWQEKVFRAVAGSRLDDFRNLLNSEMLKFTLDFSQEYKGYKCSPIQIAIDNGSIEALQLLLQAGASPDFAPLFSVKPLLRAICLPDCTDMVNLLLQHSADILSSEPRYPAALLFAISICKVDHVENLLQHGAMTPSNNSKYKNECFMRAASLNKSKILELILDNADKNRIDIPSELIFSNTAFVNHTRHENVQLMMTRGFIPSQSSTSEIIFIDAATLNISRTMNMMLAQSPMLLQQHKVELQKIIRGTNTSFPKEYVTWI